MGAVRVEDETMSLAARGAAAPAALRGHLRERGRGRVRTFAALSADHAAARAAAATYAQESINGVDRVARLGAHRVADARRVRLDARPATRLADARGGLADVARRFVRSHARPPTGSHAAARAAPTIAHEK